MGHPETNSASTVSEPHRVDSIDPNGDGQSHGSTAPEDALDEQVRFRGVFALDVPREVIARFSGTLVLNALPERQPEIILDPGRQLRNNDDE